ncbi:PHD and RING finger domain-containing protein 1 [Tetrabaena socialis]|uniref:PHD and RING finger domain-containing protein 1 n=1 Tax=Tetrabaena socialis TaxID=47790 RepID=A0A2J8AEI2_9CHLO|nr:PHD and RING finger domain-containing protein 1 [Tetrabaena socialis]|eukprot:PNH10928.1 PHD and RING finger domain-containing protein 1 [Tetrabaena socialis]
MSGASTATGGPSDRTDPRPMSLPRRDGGDRREAAAEPLAARVDDLTKQMAKLTLLMEGGLQAHMYAPEAYYAQAGEEGSESDEEPPPSLVSSSESDQDEPPLAASYRDELMGLEDCYAYLPLGATGTGLLEAYLRGNAAWPRTPPPSLSNDEDTEEVQAYACLSLDPATYSRGGASGRVLDDHLEAARILGQRARAQRGGVPGEDQAGSKDARHAPTAPDPVLGRAGEPRRRQARVSALAARTPEASASRGNAVAGTSATAAAGPPPRAMGSAGERPEEDGSGEEGDPDPGLVCVVCRQAMPASTMLLCDYPGCETGWHTRCLDPPLTGVPLGEWFCPLHGSPLLLDSEEKAAPGEAAPGSGTEEVLGGEAEEDSAGSEDGQPPACRAEELESVAEQVEVNLAKAKERNVRDHLRRNHPSQPRKRRRVAPGPAQQDEEMKEPAAVTQAEECAGLVATVGGGAGPSAAAQAQGQGGEPPGLVVRVEAGGDALKHLPDHAKVYRQIRRAHKLAPDREGPYFFNCWNRAGTLALVYTADGYAFTIPTRQLYVPPDALPAEM